MKTQTIRTNEMTLRPFFGRTANQATCHLTGAASDSTDVTIHDQKEVNMKTQVSKRHTDALGVQRRTILTSMLNPGVLWRAFIMLLLIAAIVVPGAAQGIYVANDDRQGIGQPYIAHTPITGGTPTVLPLSFAPPSYSFSGGLALSYSSVQSAGSGTLYFPYARVTTDIGDILGCDVLTGACAAFSLPSAYNLVPKASAALEGKLFFISGYAIHQYDFATHAICTLVNYEPQRIAAYPGPAGTVNLFVTYSGWRPNSGSLVEYNVVPSPSSPCPTITTTTLVSGLNYPEGVAVSLDGNYVYFVIPNTNPLTNNGEIHLYDRYLGITSTLVPNILYPQPLSGTPYDLALAGLNGDGSSNLFVTLRDGVSGSYGAVGEYNTYGAPVNTTLINTGLDYPVGIAVSPGDGTTFCTPPPSNLVAWYSFDQNLPSGAQYDLAKGNDATAYPAPPLGPQNVLGKVSNALSFNGTDDYVEALDRPWLNMGRGDLSIDAWIKIAPGDDSGIRVLVDKRQSSPLQGYHFFLYHGQLGMQLADNISGWYNYLSTVPFNLADDQWHLIAVTVRRNSPIPVGTFYVDGISKGTFSPANRMGSLDNSGNLEIGVREASLGGGSSFKGQMDEVEIFNRALSNMEVFNIWRAGSAGKCK